MNLLLTGRPAVGKTTALVEVARRCASWRAGGFVTEEVREHGQRVGFALTPLGGARRIMAHRDFVSPHRVGRYGVDVESIDYVADIALSPRAQVDLFVVDEIGKMECLSSRFVQAMRRLLDDARPVIATVAARGGGLIAEVKRRADVQLWEVTSANRQAMPARVVTWFKQRADRASDTTTSP